MTITIGADLVPTKQNYDLFKKGNADVLVGKELTSLLKKTDIKIFNLETVVGEKGLPIKKVGPYLRCPEECFSGIAALNPTVLSIANNHVMDYGEEGLLETIRIIEKNNIKWVGAGRNINSLKKYIVIEKNEIKIGIYSCTEHEFSISDSNFAGCNPYDPLYSFDDIREVSQKCDYLIVLYHGNKEYYRYPSPDVQRVCRKFAECGANIVLCQHSHCIGSAEKYGQCELVYGQGNFLFYGGETNEFFQAGALVQVEIDEYTKNSFVTYIPVVRNGFTIRLASEQEKKKILEEFECRSEKMKDLDFVKKNYLEFSKTMLEIYYSRCLAKVRRNILFRIINKISKRKLIGYFFSDNDCLSILNMIECEAHRELFIEGLKASIYRGKRK